MTRDLTLEDLASTSGLTLRTLRYYIQEGLLPGPDTHGKNAHYSQQHLDRLELIQRMKNLHLSLQEMRQLLETMTPDEIGQIRQFHDTLQSELKGKNAKVFEPSPSIMEGSSALEYIRSLEQGRQDLRAGSRRPESKSQILQASNELPAPAPEIRSMLVKEQEHDYQEQEHWTRIILEDGLELNIRQPRRVDEQAKLAKLLRYARTLFGNQGKNRESKDEKGSVKK